LIRDPIDLCAAENTLKQFLEATIVSFETPWMFRPKQCFRPSAHSDCSETRVDYVSFPSDVSETDCAYRPWEKNTSKFSGRAEDLEMAKGWPVIVRASAVDLHLVAHTFASRSRLQEAIYSTVIGPSNIGIAQAHQRSWHPSFARRATRKCRNPEQVVEGRSCAIR